MVNLSVRNLTRETPETRMRVEEQRQFVLPKAMLAKPGTLNLLNSNNHIAETKWDGTRVFLVKRNGKVRLFVARGKNNEYTQRYRQLVMDGIQTKCNSCILDGEFLFINKEGRNIFLTMAAKPETIRNSNLHFMYVCFDILEKNGVDLKDKPLEERKEILRQTVPSGLPILKKTKMITANLESFFEEQLEKKREGIILKQKQTPYVEGRSNYWLKIKKTETHDVIVGGYTRGTGAREPYFGALKCYLPDSQGNLIHIGDVGTGFNLDDLRMITPMLRNNNKFVIEVKFLEWTEDKKMRFPSFVKFREDKNITDVVI